jgi:hypothetical protein
MDTLMRLFAVLFGAILFSVIVPVAYYFAFNQLLFNSSTGIALLVGIGFILGGLLGTVFPRVFGFVLVIFFGE